MIDRPLITVILCCLLALAVVSARAENSVIVESKCVEPGSGPVTVGIHIANDLPITGLVLPFELRSLESGAFIAKSLDVKVQGRLTPWVKGSSFAIQRTMGTPSSAMDAKDCLASDGLHTWFTLDSAADFRSPDAILYACVGLQPETIAPGDDGKAGSGTPSMVLSFHVGATRGKFVIDSVCVPPGNHLVFVPESGARGDAVVPRFEPGLITVGCPGRP
ncbi:MAG TPA: hypothetical protein VGB22_04740 [candidate division Zixibacteria bacterium]|jgi:hypothetical protein